MQNKSLKIPSVIIAIGIIVSIIACLLTGILKTPTITEQDFAYFATYKLNGETKKLEGVYRVQFKGTGEGIDPLERYYEGFYLSDPTSSEPESHKLAKKDDLELRVVFIFTDDYLMGDGDKGDVYSDVIPEPYLAVYDGMGVEYSDPETLEKFNAELVSWETPRPIDNTFAFAGFSMLHTGSMFAMLLVGLLVIVASIIFVKRDKTLQYNALDKASVVLNYIVVFAAIPFITIVMSFMQIVVSGDEFLYQAGLCIPAITAFAIATSLSLRRRGFTKSGFFVQFSGPALFILFIILGSVL